MVGARTRRNAGGAPTNDSGTPEPISVVSCISTPALAQTPAPAQAPALTPAPASVPGPPRRYTDKKRQKATKLALKSFIKGQKHGQLQGISAPCKQLLKARFPDLYYRNSYLDCYCFCQQCEDYFETAKSNRLNRVFFAASFLCIAMIQR